MARALPVLTGCGVCCGEDKGPPLYRKLIQDLGLRSGTRVVAGFIQAAAFALLARAVGPTAFGVFAQASAVTFFVLGLLGFGFSTRALRLQAETDAHRLVASMYLIRYFVSAIVLATLCPAVYVLAPSGLVGVLTAGVVFSVSEHLNELSQAVYSGMRRQGAVAGHLLLRRSVLFAAVGGAQLLPGSSLLAFSIVSSLAVLFPLALAAGSLSHPLPTRSTIASSRGYWLAGSVNTVSRLDVVVAGVVTTPQVVGLYAAASRIGGPLAVVSSSLTSILVPEMAHEKDRERYWRLFRQSRLACWLYAAILVAFSPVIAAVALQVLGPGFSEGRAIMIAICIGAGLSGVSQVYQSHLYSSGLASRVAIGIGVGAASHLLLLAACGSLFGVDGLALAIVVSQGILLVAFIALSRRSV